MLTRVFTRDTIISELSDENMINSDVKNFFLNR